MKTNGLMVFVGAGAIAACGSFGAVDDATTMSSPASDAGASETGNDATNADANPSDGTVPPAKTIIGVSDLPITWLAVDATRVVWSTTEPEAGTIHDLLACPKTGCVDGKPTVLAASAPVGVVASDGTKAVVGYATQGRGVVRFDGDIPALIVGGANNVDQATVRDGTVWYTVFQDAYARALNRVPLAGGVVETIGTYAPQSAANSSHVVVAKERAFFGSHSSSNIGYCALDKSGCGELAATSAYGLALATDDEKLFWSDGDTMRSCPVDATPPCTPQQELPEAASAPWVIVHRGGSLFMTMKNGDLLQCTSSDCAATRKTLSKNESFDTTWSLSAVNVAIDDDAVYYATHDGAEYRINRLPRTNP